MFHDFISNFFAISIGMLLVGLLQMRGTRAGYRRIQKAADHFEAANDAHDDFLRKAREDALSSLEKLRQATYVAEMQTGLPEQLRISKEVPEEIRSMPTMRPRTPAQRARARKARTHSGDKS